MNPEEIPQPSMVGDKPDVETFEGQFDVTKKNGVTLTINFKFEYPKGEGLVFWKVLSDFKIPDQTVLDHLMATGDESLLARAAQMGWRDYDEDDDYDEDED